MKIDRTVTHGVACSVNFYGPEDNRVELYYTTPYEVRQLLGEHTHLDEPDAKLLAFAQSFEEKKGPPRAAAGGVIRRPVVALRRPAGEIMLGRRPYSPGRRRGACGYRDRPCSGPGLGCGQPTSRA